MRELLLTLTQFCALKAMISCKAYKTLSCTSMTVYAVKTAAQTQIYLLPYMPEDISVLFSRSNLVLFKQALIC